MFGETDYNITVTTAVVLVAHVNLWQQKKMK